MDHFDSIFTLFTAEIESRDGTNVIVVPDRELKVGELEAGKTYRVAILPQANRSGPTMSDSPSSRQQSRANSPPPVDEGEVLEVEIDDVGEQDDGIARIGPGYVVFVPDTDIGDRVTIEITEIRDNFAFAEVVEREPLSE